MSEDTTTAYLENPATKEFHLQQTQSVAPALPQIAALIAAGAIMSSTAAQSTTLVQWRTADGGNGHWYQLVVESSGLSWPSAKLKAEQRGGNLASLGEPGEANFVRGILNNSVCGGSTLQAGPYVGGYQDLSASDYSEPAGGWRWLDGTPFPGAAYVTLDNSGGDQRYVHFISLVNSCSGPFQLDDVGLVTQNKAYIIEWSADCNNDGIVDYGQIRTGQLPDQNGNGVPDSCDCQVHPELAFCCPGDINADRAINGADVGILLGYWGEVLPTTPPATDINRDGVVNGADLGMLLSHWGPCAP